MFLPLVNSLISPLRLYRASFSSGKRTLELRTCSPTCIRAEPLSRAQWGLKVGVCHGIDRLQVGPLYIAEVPAELPGRYKLGGFHLLLLNSRLRDDRYEAWHKLGFGAFGTVWLARDAV